MENVTILVTHIQGDTASQTLVGTKASAEQALQTIGITNNRFANQRWATLVQNYADRHCLDEWRYRSPVINPMTM